MTEASQKTLFGLSPAKYGIASLVTACLAWACWPLMLVVGFFIVFCIDAVLVLIAVVCGLTGLATGIFYKDFLGSVTATLGLFIISCGVWAISNAMQF